MNSSDLAISLSRARHLAEALPLNAEAAGNLAAEQSVPQAAQSHTFILPSGYFYSQPALQPQPGWSTLTKHLLWSKPELFCYQLQGSNSIFHAAGTPCPQISPELKPWRQLPSTGQALSGKLILASNRKHTLRARDSASYFPCT